MEECEREEVTFSQNRKGRSLRWLGQVYSGNRKEHQCSCSKANGRETQMPFQAMIEFGFYSMGDRKILKDSEQRTRNDVISMINSSC